MNDHKMPRPRGVTVLTIWLVLLGSFALVSSLYLWGEGFLWVFPPGVDYIFPVSDLLVTIPVTFIAALGLWRMTWWGYATAYFLAGVLIYSSVGVYVMLLQNGAPYGLEFVLPPIVGLVIAFVLIVYLGRIRSQFQT